MKGPTKVERDFLKARRPEAALTEQLDDYAAALAVTYPLLAEAYQALVDRLLAAGAGEHAAKNGEALPPFLLPDENGRLVSSAELLASGPLVVSFNRGNWCAFCWLELAALGDRYAEVKRRGGEVVSITPDTARYARRLKARLNLPFPVLTDLDNAYAVEMGLAIRLSAEITQLFLESGVDLGVSQRNDSWFVPIPATIVIDRAGVIRRSYVNADFRRRDELADLEELISNLA